MKTILKLEEIAMLMLSVFLFSNLTFDWWWYLVLFFLPDAGFVGYVFNTRLGAFLYNILHHKGVAIVLYIAGAIWQIEALQLAGIIMFGHAAFDRIFDYGLKYTDSFHNTHLGHIGKSSES
ncbi:conserved hypothetical protein (DUF4260) [Formosa agariphila KMM 3901]|uniref:DUF4260 domain-containing protein n=1 Tax=Formosa agariphila (strain DSM 15362 / KCTC 12365 / LMG 23005 / KMM 3901 / M-2Alg 35-1) TaxID=1347342 RepID=T2KQ59_FORAG|nr:DUF4260 domain-containing protein [Formosa agariphila]CDF80855.1 conserved hypothetical protein (DUF4260) [Formosa agariphila KMM 3901]